MHCIKADRPKEWQEARVYVLADLHIGDPQCDYAECCRRVETIKNDPNGLCVLNGDLMNTATKTSISDIYEETMSPDQQIDFMCKFLFPIKDKIIGATTGNHEERIRRLDGTDITYRMCRELCIADKYSADGIVIFLRFGDVSYHGKHKGPQWYSLYSTHGCGSGRTVGGKFNKLVALQSVIDVDVYIQSHVHAAAAFPQDFIRTSPMTSSVKQVRKLFISTGGVQDYGGYGQRAMYTPSSKANPVITLLASKKLATATL